MLNFINAEKMAESVMGFDHFVEVADSKCDIKESKDKAWIKTSYLGLDISLIIDKKMAATVEDNCDMEFVMQFIKMAKPGSELILDTNIGEMTFSISDDLTTFVNHKNFNAVMTFKNIKAKRLLFALKDFAENKISKDDFQELVNAYYYSIK